VEELSLLRNGLVSVLCLALLGMCTAALVAQRGVGPAPAPPAQTPAGRGEASPASQRPPQTKTQQSFPRDQVEAGRAQFVSQCGFCHGRDTAGGAGGPDLTRSVLVAEDVRGDRLGPFIRSGRPDRGMPAFPLSDSDLAAVVAFIHDQKLQADASNGGRRSVDATDLQSGNAAAGERYFAAACARCHSATGDLAGVAMRLQGLTLLQRMLYPSIAGRGSSGRAPQTVTVTLSSGQAITGRLAYRDEFTIAITDAAGWFRSWLASQVKFTLDDPLQAHVEQLGKYSDDDMHDVLAYLQTLR
jgi:cytochrome c oxidase cbb3-type subunit III